MGLLIRGLWFVFVGWWLGPLWFLLSLLLMVSIIFFPIGAYTITKTWAVMTLKTNPQKVVVEARAQTDD
jgi:uncharacterized membrane protein YccF (DUF307 family)